jgi:hypothetical protein
VALTPARRWDAEHGFVPTALHDERGIARRGSWFPTVALPSVGETSSWPAGLEHSASMGSMWRKRAGPRAAPSRAREVEASSLIDAMRNSSLQSSIMVHRGVDAPFQVEPMKVALLSPIPGERLRPPK